MNYDAWKTGWYEDIRREPEEDEDLLDEKQVYEDDEPEGEQHE